MGLFLVFLAAVLCFGIFAVAGLSFGLSYDLCFAVLSAGFAAGLQRGKSVLDCVFEFVRIQNAFKFMRYFVMAGLLGLSAALIGCAPLCSVPVVSHDTVVVSPAKSLLEPVPLEPFGGHTNEDLLEYVLLLSGKLELCNARIVSAKKMIDEDVVSGRQNSRQDGQNPQN